jgi:hypothetical protein
MNTRLTLPVQWALSLLVGLILGFALQPLAEEMPVNKPVPTNTTIPSTPSPSPFVTLPGGWMVRATFYRHASPQITKVIRLDQARLTTYPIGESQIQLLNSAGEILYSQSFEIEFLAGDPPRPVDEKEMIFILPIIEGTARIVIVSPNGEASYEIVGQ